MGRNKLSSFVDEKTLKQAEADLEKIPDSTISLRLLAVIGSGKGRRINEIADFLMVTRQSVFFWIKKYKSEGLKGLQDKPKGHRKKRLSPEQKKTISGWLDRRETPHGKQYHWTIDKIKIAIEKEFGIVLSRSRVGYLVQEWGFRPKVPRPKHAEGDKIAQEAFKKTPQ